jgi:hypothetical protein
MSESSIRIMCPNLVCRKVLAVPKVARGKAIRCRGCGTLIKVPSSKDTPSNSSGNSSGTKAG